MAAFCQTLLIKHLRHLSLSQKKITHLSDWIIQHKAHCKTIVNVWFKELLLAFENQKLALLYLASDIIQNTKKKFPEFIKEFGECLPKVLKHLSGLENYEELFKNDVERILQMWEEREIFEKNQMAVLKKSVELSNSNEEEDTLEEVLEGFKFGELQAVFTLSSNSARFVPRETNEVVKTLQLMKHPASSDAKIRHKIVALPEDVAKLEALDQITDKQSAMDLAKIVNYAERLTNSYNLRLEAELKDRKKLGGLLKDYMAAETEIQARAKERLKKYKAKLVKIRKLRKALKAHVEKLPDLMELPVLKGELSPLPPAGDLFKSKN